MRDVISTAANTARQIFGFIAIIEYAAHTRSNEYSPNELAQRIARYLGAYGARTRNLRRDRAAL